MSGILALPLYPNVPAALGVPPVLRQAGAVLDTVQAVSRDVASVLRAFSGPQWGLFDASARPVMAWDSVRGFEFSKEWRIADYPVEGGGFESYNKVETPYEARLSFMISGSDAARAALQAGALAAARSLEMFSVVTRDFTYLYANVTHIDFRRDDRGGQSLLAIEVWVQEVRNTAQAAFTNTRAGTGSGGVGSFDAASGQSVQVGSVAGVAPSSGSVTVPGSNISYAGDPAPLTSAKDPAGNDMVFTGVVQATAVA